MQSQIDENQMMTLLDNLYNKAIDGIPMVSQSVDEMVDNYLSRYDSVDKAAKELINYQIAKCGTSGFLTGMGGLITLPIAIPANVGSVLYVQMRMIAALAKMGGFDLRSDQVQTLVYACLTGTAMADIVKQAGLKVGEKLTISMIKSIPGKVLTSINQKVGFRLITKFGETGVVNMVKLVPLAGGVVGGLFDIGSTKIVAANAYYIFIKKQVPDEETQKKASIDIKLITDNVMKGVSDIGSDIGNAAQNLKQVKLPELKLPEIKKQIQLPGIKVPNISLPTRKVKIETGRLVLRAWKAEDAEECYKYASDPDIGPNAGWPVHTNVEDSMFIIETVLSEPETYAIVSKETGLPIGSVGIKRGNKSEAVTNSKEAEIGCWIGKPYWNNGYATEAVMALIGRCFNNLKCSGIWYCCYLGNEKSRRVAEKCGFKYHHTVENMEVPLLGERKTTYFMYMKKE